MREGCSGVSLLWKEGVDGSSWTDECHSLYTQRVEEEEERRQRQAEQERLRREAAALEEQKQQAELFHA